jgi:putative ABC transport system permease protein
MFRVALKSLLGRKLRLLLSTFAIVLGVAFVSGSLVFSDTLSRSFTALFASTVGDVVVRPEGATTVDGAPTTRTLPASLVDDLSTVEGAARVDGNVSAIGVYVVGTDGKVIGGQGAPGIGVSHSTAPAGHGLEGFVVVDGRAPETSDEVVLDEVTAEKAGYAVGDRARVITASEQAILQPTVVGLAGYRDGGSLNGATIAVFDVETAQDLFLKGEDAFNDIWVTAEDGVSQEDLRDAVAAELPPGVEAVTGDTAADQTATDLLEAISFLRTFLLIFAGIALVVGAFLIVNTFSILVAQRSRELALLRAMGASRRQVMSSVLVEAFVLGVLGATMGLGLGVLLALGIRALFATFGLDITGQALVFEPTTVVAAYAVGIVVTMLAALLPAIRTTRITPVQALTDDIAMPAASMHRRLVVGTVMIVAGAIAMAAALLTDIPRAGWVLGLGILTVLLGVAGVSPVISRPFLELARKAAAGTLGAVGNLAGLNSLRNPRRTAATASALMIGLALATTMAIVGDSAKASVDKTIDDNFVGDYVVSSLVGDPFSPTVAQDIAEVPGVEQVVAQRWAYTRIDGQRQAIGAADPASIRDVLRVEVVDGALEDVGPGTIAVSDDYADDEGIGVGDEITVDVPSGEETFPVVAVFTDNPLVSFPLVTDPQTLVDAGFQDADNFLIVNTSENNAAMQDALEAVVADLPIVTVKDQAGFAAEQREPIDQLVLMIYALLGLALLIAALGIVNTLALSVIERTREVGLLRAIGFSRSQLRRMITVESVVIAVLGAVLGVVLGIGFGSAMMRSLRDEGLEVVSVPVMQLVAFLLLAVIIGLVAALFPARRAGRLDVLNAIATE